MERRTIRRGDVEDRLSSLPDEILCKILFLLPETKYAVRTSLLSRKWLHLYTNVPVLHFHFSDTSCTSPAFPYYYFGRRPKDSYYKSFTCFLDNVLARNVSPIIHKFSLHYDNTTSANNHSIISIFRINDWLHTVMSRNVVELDLTLNFTCPDDDYCACNEVALWLSNGFELQVLKIKVLVPLRMPSFCNFINLKNFHIELQLADMEFASELFTKLPKLEELYVSITFNLEECSDFNIIAPVLKVLHISLRDEDKIREVKVLIDAPMLEHISITNDSVYAYTFRNLSSNIRAKINVLTYCVTEEEDDDPGHAIELIRGLSCVKSLSLSQSTMEAKSIAYADNLPLFLNLTKLEIFVNPSLWNFLLLFFKSAPNLEILVLEMENSEEDQDFDLSQICPMPHLKEVEIKGDQMVKGAQLLSYIMKNASVLNKFTVNNIVFF